MANRKNNANPANTSGATVGYETELWRMADALRGSMDAAEYKHVVLGLIFLKYISDAFEEHHARLAAEQAQGADPEDPDEYKAENIFWVPSEARWSNIQRNARQPNIGKLVDDAMAAVERDNPSLKGVLPKDYARPALDKQRLGQLIDMVTNINLGGAENHARDILGRVYEYFLGQFASAEGRKGGEFYTPRCVVKLLVEMLEPYRGRVYDPCCGSAGMFVQSVEFIRAHATGNGNGGRPAPSYERSNESSVVVVLPGGQANLDFVRLVVEEARAGRDLRLDELLLLNALWQDRRLTTEEAACLTRKPESDVRVVLNRLVEAGLVEPRGERKGRTWHLSAATYRRLGQPAAYVRQRGFEPLQQEQMVLQYVDKFSRITREETCTLCQVGPYQAYRLLKGMVEKGLLIAKGQKKARYYELRT